ncbi:plexin-A4-like isoform X2 [Asterias amurensis]|uniref:plexin-A4-like isoform X2 n=1 Tax=Asterias amurensis TaxID=7602 RepID=UPI003AB5F6F7
MEAQRSHVIILLAVYLILLGLLSSVVSAEWQGDLSSYHIASFSNPHPPRPLNDPSGNHNAKFNHFTLSGPDGAVYVGAVNYLYRLDSSLNLLQNVSTCQELGEDRCDTFTNYNKILILDNQNRLITCGSENGGKCQFRNPDDLTDVLFKPRPNVAGFGELSTVSLIAPGTDGPMGPGPDRGDWLYVAVTYSAEVGYISIPPISRRVLNSGGSLLAALNNGYSFTSVVHFDSPIPISYKSAFSFDGFTYFITYQEEDFGSSFFVSKMSRVCQTSPSFDSYTEITLQCQGSDGSVYSLVQAAHIGPAGQDLAVSLGLNAEDMVLYAVFAKNEGADGTSDVPIDQSALCVYKMSDILEAFKEAVRGCIQDGDDYSVKYMQGSFCSTFPVSVGPGSFQCHPFEGGAHVYRYAKGIDVTSSIAVLELSDTLMSSIITTIEMNHTVAIIGTDSRGELLKVHIQSKTSARLYERVDLDITGSVLKDVKMNDTTREMYILTEQKFLKMRVENCGQYTTCEACIGTDAGMDGDPYCGWCTLQRQCTLYSECKMPDVSTRWLAYNTVQCIEITNVDPYNNLPITDTEQQITVSVEQLPDLLTNMTYECWFGSYVSQATKTNEDLRCVSPPGNRIPPIQQGDDGVAIRLSIYSSETSVSFVDTSFYFYECSTHTSCVSCVDSRWACDWCVFENRCTHVSSTCAGDNEIIITGQNNPALSLAPKGPGSCPQLLAQNTEVLLPNGIERSLQVMTTNLPDQTQITSFECSFDIEGVRQSTTAQRNDDTIMCDMKAYTYSSTDEAELIVKLTIEWTDTSNKPHILDDLFNNNATLYKCGVLKPDCSRCVTARPELECVWCNAMCELRESCTTAEGDWVTHNNNANCPDPILQGVYPLSGPIEGNTIVSVMGTDIGRGFHTVLNVMIGDQECHLDGLEAYYEIGHSVSCLTQSRVESVVPVSLTVRGGDGTTLQESKGIVNFQYRVPSITSFSPRFGPAAGGTRITIIGMALNTGRNIQAFIGDKACIITSPVTETKAVCTCSEGSVGQMEILKMSFDGADKTSEVYTFSDNPVITEVSPTTSIYSGGREMVVRGAHLDTAQMASLVVTVASQITKRSVSSEGPNNIEFVESCAVQGSEFMRCYTPSITSAISSSQSKHTVTFGFIMDGVSDLLTWSEDNNVDLEFFPDPEYDEFENNLYDKMDNLLKIKGKLINNAITESEIIIYVGPVRSDVTFIEETALGCILPKEQPPAGDFTGQDKERGLPVVWVVHSNLEFRIGYISYPSANVTIAVLAVIGALTFIILVCTVIYLTIRLKRARRDADLLVLKKDLLEDVKKGLSQRKFDILRLTSDVEESGMPFVSHRDYATNMLFIGQEVRPTTTDEEYAEYAMVEEAMMMFSELLGNKNFLLIFIQTLDTRSRSKISVKERQSIASLLTVTMVLNDTLDILTDVLLTLMSQKIKDAQATNRELLLFSKTDSVFEKLLSNWVSLCLYDQLKNHTAYPLFVLYRAIKYRTEQGPIDAVTGQAEFSLNFENLLQETVNFNTLTLVVLNREGNVIKEVKVLDVDTISQVKEKILDALHLNKPYSSRPNANQVSLVWHQRKNERLILTDKSIRRLTNKPSPLKTLKDFQVPDRAPVTLVDEGTGQAESCCGPVHQDQENIAHEYFTIQVENRYGGHQDQHLAMKVDSILTEEGGYCIPTKGSIQHKIPPDKPQPELTTNAMEMESTFTEEGGYCIPTKGSIQQKIPPDKPQPELTTNAMEAESTFTEEGGYCIPTKGSIQQKIFHNEPQLELTTNVTDSAQQKQYERETDYEHMYLDNAGLEDEEQDQEGFRDWHLTQKKESFTIEEHRPEQQGSKLCCISLNKQSQWAANKVPFQRVLSSKSVIQEYVDNMFQTILSVESAPKAIKFLFDFFDDQADMYDLKSKDPEIKCAWKNNILPLRFWSNAIKHPDYIFDIQPTPSVEASMDVIGQLFHDAHDTKTDKLGQESSINKFLYSREKTKYQRLVRQYYKGVEESTPVTTQDLNTELQKASQNFTGLFSKLSTLMQLWDLLLVVLKTKDQSDQKHLGCLLQEVKETLSRGNAL